MSDTFGYPSDSPCIICEGYNNNQIEPRFGYTVCEEHQKIKPSDIEKERDNFRVSSAT